MSLALQAALPATFQRLNSAQLQAAQAPEEALLIRAGAGSGKTSTLAHRVAHLILAGCDPGRVLLLTFTRRAALEMTERARRILGAVRDDRDTRDTQIRWSGTFHSVANRLLRLHGAALSLDPAFTVLDRSDSADLMNLVRSDGGLAAKDRRFPRKGTCLAIYSRCVNAEEPLEQALQQQFPWCREWEAELRELFRGYVAAKQERHVLDYDDLLLSWAVLMEEPGLAAQVGERFQHVLVDEYQDTNAVQARILRRLRPDGRGLTVVGDDAQAIYSFRAASVQNILAFAGQYPGRAQVVTLAENYRSTRPIIEAAGAVLSLSPLHGDKPLVATREADQRPYLATVEDEIAQVTYVVERILENREAGRDLKEQAVLFRTSHHSDALEVELGRRNIPFVKFGGLRFLEAAHVKDLLCVLRWAENPRDTVAAFRILQLLPGIGPAAARRILAHAATSPGDWRVLAEHQPPTAARAAFEPLCALLAAIGTPGAPWEGQVEQARRWYDPILHDRYDSSHARQGDLVQLEQLAAESPSRERFLSELTLDPPDITGAEAGDPLLDEDFLILSTIHSAKGQEWDVVFLLNVADGCIPSDMATGSPELVEEERRLLYVAMTRARDELHLVHPQRMYVHHQRRFGDRHVYTPLTRFVPESIHGRFDRVARLRQPRTSDAAGLPPVSAIDLAARLRAMW